MNKELLTILSGIVIAFGFLNTATAQQSGRFVSNIDRRIGPRTAFQKPLAYDIADHTVLIEGVMFSGGQYLFDAVNTQGLVPGNGDDFEAFYGGLLDLRVARKASNAISYGFDSRLLFSGSESSDSDVFGRYDVYLRGRYGQISYGNFADRDSLHLSGRNTLSGEANLFYDGFFSPSDARAFRYRGRFSSFLVDAAIDEDGENYNMGFLYRSPHRFRKNSWSFDFHGGDYLNRYDRKGVTLAHGISYGSWDFTLAGSWDQFDPYANFATFDRVSGSFITSYKHHAYTWSAGVLLAETNDGELETAYTAGLRYDMARGLSLNAGYFYIDSESLGTDGQSVTAGDFSGVRTSISYRF